MTTAGEAVGDIGKMLVDFWGVDRISLPGKRRDLPSNSEVDDFARLMINHTGGNQGSISSGYNGEKIWDVYGNFVIELYFPATGDVREYYDKAEAVKELYQGKRSPNDVWFRNCAVRDVNPYNSWYRLNVYCEFEYYKVA